MTWTDYTSAAALFNLQILPESLMCGVIILAILLANQPMFVLGAGVAGTQLLGLALGRLVMKYDPANSMVRSTLDTCSAGYVGKTWDRLLRGGTTPDLLWHPLAPSIYLATVGFFAGWGFGLQQLYKDEIDAGILQRSTILATTVITLLLLLLAIVYRIYAGCESIKGALIGSVFGLVAGYFLSITVGFSTDKRATNIWGIPLLRDRINEGEPVYICPPKVD